MYGGGRFDYWPQPREGLSIIVPEESGYGKRFGGFKVIGAQQNSDLGLHVGIRLHLGPLNADIRYDRGLNSNELSLLEKNNIPTFGTVDLQSNIWSIGFSYKL